MRCMSLIIGFGLLITFTIPAFAAHSISNEEAKDLSLQAGWSHNATALSRLRAAAESGNANDESWLGSAYADLGNGAEALKWYRKAVAQGDASAAVGVEMMYKYGRGVPKNEARVLEWYNKARTLGAPCQVGFFCTQSH